MIEFRNKREGKTCVIWTRVSTKYQEDNGGSLETQKETCEEYANKHGYKVAGYFGGKHESAKTPGKMVTEMYNYVRKHKEISTILVSEFDRFSRASWQACKMLDEMRALGIIVIATKYGLNTETKEGMLMAKNTLNMAEWDNQNRTDKFTDGREKCFRSGAWVQKPPFGYYKEGKSRETWCYLNEKGKLLRYAFKWKLAGYSNSEILDKLSALGLVITKQVLHRVLTSPFYAGKICHQYTHYEMVDGQIEPAVTYIDFLKVQEIMSGRTGKYTQNKHNPCFPLTKHVICADDDTPFTAYTKEKKSKNTVYHYDYYKCNKAGCKTNVTAKEMHEKYEALLNRYNLPEELVSSFASLIKGAFRKVSDELVSQRTLLKKKLTEIDNDIKNVRVRYATGKIDEETYETAMKEFNNRRDLVIIELDKCNLNLSNYEKQIPIVIATASNISGLWHNADLDSKRKIQNLIFPNGIFWDKHIADYRTFSRNKFFDLMDRFSVTYGNKKEAVSSDTVSLCGR